MHPKTVSRRSFLVGAVAFAATASTGIANAASVTSVLRGDAIKWNGTVINLDPLKKYYRSSLLKHLYKFHATLIQPLV
ncbi:MAG: hypothetical protein AAFX96_07695, partial [Pseudomonadota bacterium]